MNKLLIPIMIFSSLMCSNSSNSLSDYEKLWNEVEKLEQDGLYKSCLDKVNAIFELAVAERVADHQIKALIHRLKYQSYLAEQSSSNELKKFELDILGLKDRSTQKLAYSLMGEALYQYASMNISQLNNRTNLDEESDDMEQWSLKQFYERSYEYYFKSVEDIDFLKNHEIKEYDDILNLVKRDDKYLLYADNLYEFLHFRAAKHFANDYSYITSPVNTFKLNDPNLFSNAKQFIDINITADDRLNFDKNAVLFFQNLLKYYDGEDDLKFSAIDIKRLNYLRSKSSVAEKDDLFLDALKEGLDMAAGVDAKALFALAIAQRYMEIGSGYRGNYEFDKKGYYEKAHQLLVKYKTDRVAVDFDEQLAVVKDIELSIQTEEVYLPETFVKVAVNYRNVAQLNLKLIKLDSKQLATLNKKNDRQEGLNFLNNITALRSWRVGLPSHEDYDPHATELPIEPLTLGHYVILGSSSNTFSFSNDKIVAINHFAVSQLAFTQANIDGGSKIVVVNRASGEPVENAEVSLYSNVYDPGSRSTQRKLFTKGKTNENGEFDYKEEVRSFTVKLRKGKDEFVSDQRFNNYRYREGRKNIEINLFTDRVIYRPGQIVYVKALAIQKDAKSLPTIQRKLNLNLVFRDANYQIIAEKKLRTNDFGTANTSFTIPASGLNGSFQIEAKTMNGSGYKSIKVEEYKRPSFYIEMDTLEQAYKSGDELMLTATAKRYNGASIPNALVKYQVNKSNFVHYWCDFYRPYIPFRQELELISQGETTTNENGIFSIRFKSTQEKSEWIRSNYNIEVSVTDDRGETREESKNILLTNDALIVSTDLASDNFSDNLKSIEITVNNADKKPVAVNIEAEIEQLNGPKEYLKNNYWGKTDVNFMVRKEFKKMFPDYSFGDELNPEKWEIIRKVVTRKLSGLNPELNLDKLASGYYKLKLKVTDEKGNSSNYLRYFNVADHQEMKAPAIKALWVSNVSKEYAPGENVELKVVSSDGNQSVYYTINKMLDDSNSKWLKLNKEKVIRIPVTEKDRGGISVDLWLVKDNRFYSYTRSIEIPWSNKNLDIEIVNFREKMYPGEDASLKLIIKNKGIDIGDVELLASMYDASLDAFVKNEWKANFYPGLRSRTFWRAVGFSLSRAQAYRNYDRKHYERTRDDYLPSINWFGALAGRYDNVMVAKRSGAATRNKSMPPQPQMELEYADQSVSSAMSIEEDMPIEPGEGGNTKGPIGNTEKEAFGFSPRENLNETVFFYPEIYKDANGDYFLEFKNNEALTEWKLQAFAHTKNLEYGFLEKRIKTTKELMILPHVPRFLREGDEIKITSSLTNLSSSDLDITSKIIIENAISLSDITDEIVVGTAKLSNNVEANGVQTLEWKLKIPENQKLPLKLSFLASAGSFTDGEAHMLPVLSNTKLVTETKAFYVNSGSSSEFEIDALEILEKSNSAKAQNLVLEVTSNPVWFAIKSLPYLNDYGHENAVDIVQKLYANLLAKDIVVKYPKIKTVLAQWQKDPEALKSNLSKNIELKNAELNETPWVREAASEEEQMHNIALLFNDNNLNNSISESWRKLKSLQLSNGGFTWHQGGRDSWYITQSVLNAIGHLDKLGIDLSQVLSDDYQNVIDRAVSYLDKAVIDYYKRAKGFKNKNLSPLLIQYLYTRSFFNQEYVDEVNKIVSHLYEVADEKWVDHNTYLQGMIALSAKRDDRNSLTDKIIRSLNERAIRSEKLGVFWKRNLNGFNWYDNQIQTQALLIELYHEIDPMYEMLDGMKLSLLKNKQTNRWDNAQNTAYALYALLLDRVEWINDDAPISIKWGDENIKGERIELGTGYFKISIPLDKIGPAYKSLSVQNEGQTVSWGAIYFQYFEELNNIEQYNSKGLSIKKEVFKMHTEDDGDKLYKLTSGEKLVTGDDLIVRIELINDRPMEFVHLKDMRASGLEPTNVLSQHKWQSGLSYYETTKDEFTSFYFDYLPKGNFVFEYRLKATHRGHFSNGITEVQSMYAPEFGNHSQGVSLEIGR